MIQGIITTSLFFRIGVGLARVGLKILVPELTKATGDTSLKELSDKLDPINIVKATMETIQQRTSQPIKTEEEPKAEKPTIH